MSASAKMRVYPTGVVPLFAGAPDPAPASTVSFNPGVAVPIPTCWEVLTKISVDQIAAPPEDVIKTVPLEPADEPIAPGMVVEFTQAAVPAVVCRTCPDVPAVVMCPVLGSGVPVRSDWFTQVAAPALVCST